MDAVTAQGTGAGGLATRGARWALVFAWALGGVKAFIDEQLTPEYFTLPLACTLCLVAVFLLTRRENLPLTGPAATLVTVLLLIALVFTLLAPPEEASIWQVHFTAQLIALLFVRGNPVHAYAGAVAHLAAVAIWASVNSVPLTAFAQIMTAPLVAYAAGLIWLHSLRLIVARERAHRSEAAEHARQISAEQEAAERIGQELELVRSKTEDVLARLRDGTTLDEGFRTEIAVIEGEMRDRIRSPRLQHPELNRAIAEARGRGASVSVLADDSPDAPHLPEAAAHEVAEVLRGATDSDALVIAWTEPERVSIVARKGGQNERHLVEAIPADDEPAGGARPPQP